MKRWRQALFLAPFLLLALLWMATWPPAMPGYEAVRERWRPSESWLYDRSHRLLDSARVDYSARRLQWTPIDRIPRPLIDAIIRAEDRSFRVHHGVDWLAVAAGIRTSLNHGHARGASTLTMQLAGFLAPELARPGARGGWEKARQIRAAMALDSGWTKDQVLEAYLNLAGFRGETQGIAAATQALFGKPPERLSADEAVVITALLPNPQAPPEAVARRACALDAVRCTSLRPLVAQALGPTRRLAIDPGLAPHLATKLLRQPGLAVTTTLDGAIQRTAITALGRQLVGLGEERARDGAVIVLDNASGDVLAYVGGVGGHSTAAQVDGADAPRQAGSTLKPFLYASAIEAGYLTAASILDDSPVQLDTASGLYVPQNYDRGFKGPVSARSALAGSLNVPAVRTLLLVGVDPFRDRLNDVGYQGLTEDGSYYGFSLALGSAEVTLAEQANAYRTLANGGRWSPYRLVPGPAIAPRPIIDPAASWIVADMMADPGARARTFGLDSALRLPFWAAVKTGTSKAMRDNWCIGFTDRFTVAVWIGNLEGDSMRAVSGTSGAAPVWREIMLALHHDHPGHPPPRPPGIEQRLVRFDNGIEPPRLEWFRAGTTQARFAAPPAEAQRPRIAAPISGTVYALDPDIPPDGQRIRIDVRGAVAGLRLLFNRRDLGPAEARPLIEPMPGVHRLALVDAGGKAVDQVRFTIR